jgi:hypothetical protein
MRLRAPIAALFLAGQVVFSSAELILHAIYGIRAVQGGPTHLAVMASATFGVFHGRAARAAPLAQERRNARSIRLTEERAFRDPRRATSE